MDNNWIHHYGSHEDVTVPLSNQWYIFWYITLLFITLFPRIIAPNPIYTLCDQDYNTHGIIHSQLDEHHVFILSDGEGVRDCGWFVYLLYFCGCGLRT